MNTATVTSLDTSPNGLMRRPVQQVAAETRTMSETVALRKAFREKYRHVAAMHSETRPSCLSHDSTVSPSFLGFRNLMVIVLGVYLPAAHVVPLAATYMLLQWWEISVS